VVKVVIPNFQVLVDLACGYLGAMPYYYFVVVDFPLS
jgi:hypothetical protein